MVKGKKDCKKKTKDVQNETIEVVQRDCDPIESTSVLNNNDEETVVVEASSRAIVKRRRKAMPIGITTYCNPGKIVALLNELKCSKPVNLKVVVDIGFGGLLTMKLTKFHRNMVPWLVQKFDADGHLFIVEKNQKEFAITDYDCHDVFGLPLSNIRVPRNSVRARSDEYMYVRDLKSYLGLPDGDISLKTLNALLLNLDDGDSKFLAMFLLYVSSTFLNPTANKTVDFSLSKAVLDSSLISKVNWSGYVVECLCRAVKVCKRVNEDGGYILRGKVGGCILLLEIIYFHQFLFRGVKAPTTLPLIQHWDDVLVSERIKKEKLSSFGAAILDLGTYPISSSLNVLSLSGLSSKNSTPPVDGVTDKASLYGEKRVLVYSLPDELETDEEIHAKAGGDDCLKSLLLYKRDVELISSIHLHRLNEVKNKRNDSIRHSNDEGSPILSQTQLTDHDFDLIDKAVAQFSKMNDLIKKMPSFDIFQDFDVVQEDGGSIDVTNVNIVEEIHDKACDDAVDVVEKVQISDDFLCLFCDFDCGPKNVKVKFFSSYLVEHKKQMKCLPQRQQKLMDYVFFVDDKANLSEDLCSFQKGMTITRENMQTLVASREIHSSIIETWCFMLNEHVKQNLKSGQDDYRFFFGLSHMVIIQQMFDDNHNGDKHEDLKIAMKKYIVVHRLKQRFLSAKLIFIPVICDSHYYCVVVNFYLKKIQILDNRKYGAVDELKFSVFAPILVEIIDCIFKEYKCVVTTVSTFNIEIVPFHWKTPIRNTRNADSSVFLMLHMFFFEGQNFQSDFNEYLRRRLYKVAIGAAIILHPLNTCRLNILQKVEEFNLEKNKRLNDEDKTTQIRVYAKKKSRLL